MTVVRGAVRSRSACCCWRRGAGGRGRAHHRSSSATSTVQRNGDLIVTETIRVEAEGNVIRRGIFRDFPTIYRAPDGTPRRGRLPCRVGDAQRRDRELFAIEQLSNGVRVRIGSADRLHPARPAHLRDPLSHHAADRLLRRLRRALLERHRHRLGVPDRHGRGADHAAGEGAVPADRDLHRPAGRAGKDATVVEQQPGRIVFRTTRPLPPRNGLTVAAAWQKGVVEPPTAAQLARVLARGQSRRWSSRLVGLRAAARLLRLRLAAGRPRSAGRHHHPAVRPAGRACRRRRRAMSTACRSTTRASPPRSSISA